MEEQLVRIILNLIKKYNIKLNQLSKQPLSRNKDSSNIWNDISYHIFKSAFDYKKSLKVKQRWIRLSRKHGIKNLIEKFQRLDRHSVDYYDSENASNFSNLEIKPQPVTNEEEDKRSYSDNDSYVEKVVTNIFLNQSFM